MKIDTIVDAMKTILQLALAAISRINLSTLRKIWESVENAVGGLELASHMSGSEKLARVIERTTKLVPQDRRELAGQIIGAIVEIVLILLRTRGGAR